MVYVYDVQVQTINYLHETEQNKRNLIDTNRCSQSTTKSLSKKEEHQNSNNFNKTFSKNSSFEGENVVPLKCCIESLFKKCNQTYPSDPVEVPSCDMFVVFL